MAEQESYRTEPSADIKATAAIVLFQSLLATLAENGSISRDEKAAVYFRAGNVLKFAYKLPKETRQKAWSYVRRLSREEPMQSNLTTIHLAVEHRPAYERHVTAWLSARDLEPTAKAPEDQLADGRLVYRMLPNELLDVLRHEGVPFSIAKA